MGTQPPLKICRRKEQTIFIPCKTFAPKKKEQAYAYLKIFFPKFSNVVTLSLGTKRRCKGQESGVDVWPSVGKDTVGVGRDHFQLTPDSDSALLGRETAFEDYCHVSQMPQGF